MTISGTKTDPTTPFHEWLAAQTQDLWQAIFGSPFLREVSEGNLELNRFAFFITEDLLYLDQFARVLAIGAERAEHQGVQRMFLRHAQSVYVVEEALHTSLAPKLGIDVETIRQRDPAPVTLAYTDHLLRVAQTGSLADIVSAVLPCYWVYAQVGEKLSTRLPDHEIYRAWINSYGSPDFQQAVQEQLNLIDELALVVDDRARERMRRWFTRSLRYEWMFWDQAYRRSYWPI